MGLVVAHWSTSNFLIFPDTFLFPLKIMLDIFPGAYLCIPYMVQEIIGEVFTSSKNIAVFSMVIKFT